MPGDVHILYRFRQEAGRRRERPERRLVRQRKWTWRTGRRRREERLQRREVPGRLTRFGKAPRRDEDLRAPLRHASRFAKRAPRIGGKLKRVDPGHDVEALV